MVDLAALLCRDSGELRRHPPTEPRFGLSLQPAGGLTRSAPQRARSPEIMTGRSRSPAYVSARASRRCRCHAPVFATSEAPGDIDSSDVAAVLPGVLRFRQCREDSTGSGRARPETRKFWMRVSARLQGSDAALRGLHVRVPAGGKDPHSRLCTARAVPRPCPASRSEQVRSLECPSAPQMAASSGATSSCAPKTCRRVYVDRALASTHSSMPRSAKRAASSST